MGETNPRRRQIRVQVGSLPREQREAPRNLTGEVGRWSTAAWKILRARTRIAAEGRAAGVDLLESKRSVGPVANPVWTVIPLPRESRPLLGQLARANRLPRVHPTEEQILETLCGRVSRARTDVRKASGVRRLFAREEVKDRAALAVQYLQEFQAWARQEDVPALLARLEGDLAKETGGVTEEKALDPDVGLAGRLLRFGRAKLYGPPTMGDFRRSMTVLRAGLSREAALQKEALEAGRKVREYEVRRLLSEMPLERLREATAGRLSLSAVSALGISNVQQLLDAGPRIQEGQGIGPTTASRMLGAAQSIWHTTMEETPFRVDIKQRPAHATAFLQALAAWDAVRGFGDDEEVTDAYSLLEVVLDAGADHYIAIEGDRSLDDLDRALASLEQQTARIVGGSEGPGKLDPWVDFLDRPAHYYALIALLGFNVEDEDKSHAGLPAEIVAAARRVELDTKYLNASLRGYQAFAARFSIAQRRVIIGDEMGLGKTVEALAVLAHLRAKGEHHFLVICPAAVVTNWIREIRSKSRLSAHRLHGQERAQALKAWLRQGGVAVTTFGTLRWLEGELDRESSPELGCTVVDEAHYIKNPRANRSMRTAEILKQGRRVILMTGTPLENKTEEFRTLVGYVRPDLTVDGDDLSPRRFRKQVAPVYLRRNTEDVLKELPELVEVNEWVPLSGMDMTLYERAVMDGNFMAMRQAALLGGADSGKVQRIVDLVREAEENQRRVLVFSFFREVLEQVARSLPGDVYGPINGAMPADVRQRTIDKFSRAGHGAVLVSQILAGGVGLNIQAASIVIICEPQLKPTTEWQAIARARRMGQVHTVQVHRLLSEEGVDRRITDILEQKRQVFEAFARDSDVADSAPEAYDVSEAELARQVVAEERERLLGGPRSVST